MLQLIAPQAHAACYVRTLMQASGTKVFCFFFSKKKRLLAALPAFQAMFPIERLYQSAVTMTVIASRTLWRGERGSHGEHTSRSPGLLRKGSQ